MKRAAIVVILTFGVSPLAHGAGKYTKKDSEITANQTALTKPVQAKKEEKHRPSITADDVFGGVGEKVKSVTDKQIMTMKQLIDTSNDNDPEKPDYLFRLAELYNEQYRYYDFRARELDEKMFQAQQAGNNPSAQQMKGQQTDYQKKAQTWLLASAKTYIEVADHPEKYGTYKRMDEVLFYLAYMLSQVKKEDAARRYFKRLIKDYPTSKFVPWAFFAFGQYFFDNKNFEDAMKFYDKVLQYPQSSVYIYAKYYEGWVYFNLGDFKQSLATFVNVIELSQKAGTAGTKAGKAALEKEAKKDTVRAYARVGTPEKAWDFFRRVGGNYAMTMMEQLGELYNAQGQFGDAIKVYRNLMVLAPNSPKLCNWQTEVMKNTLSMTGSRATPEAVKELQRLSAVYEKVTSTPNVKKSDLQECRDNTANTLNELARVWHKEAQKTNNNDTYSLAQYLYKEYLKRFPNEKDVYMMQFYYSELLFKLGSNGDNQKYCEAAPQYSRVVQMDPNPSAKYLKEAAFAAVISWKNCLAVEESADDTKKAMIEKRQERKSETGKSKEPDDVALKEKPIPDRQKKMIEAFDTYIKYVPQSNELPKIKWAKARVYYEANHFNEAAPLFRDIAEHHPDSELAYYSTNLLFDCEIFQGKYDNLKTSLEEFCPKYSEKDATVNGQCKTLNSQLKGKMIEIKEKAGQFKEAAQLYMENAANNPNDPKRCEYLYNAGVLFERVKLIGSAIQAREALIKVCPESPNAKRALYQIGRNYQDVAAYDFAADKYEQFAEKFPGELKETPAPLALNSAVTFRRGLGENDKSIKDTALFVKNYGGRHEFIDQAAGVAFDEGQIFEQARDWGKLQKHFLEYLKNWGSKGGVDRQIIAHVKIGNILWHESCPLPNPSWTPDSGNDACVEIKRERSGGKARVQEKQSKKSKKGRLKHADLPKQCGPETKTKTIVHDRSPARVKEALTHYAEALRLFRGGAADKAVTGKEETRAGRIATMNMFASEARFKQGEVEYEKFLKIGIPEKLDFSGAPPGSSPAREKAGKAKIAESTKKFKAYLEGKAKALEAARKIYQSVILMRQAHWVIAAAARIGQLYQDFSGQLYTAPVPRAPSAPSGYPQDEFERFFHDAYCDQLVNEGDKIEAKSIEGLKVCLDKSTELSFYDEWSQLCEAELNQLKPVEYPLASEIRAQPGYAQISIDRTEVQPLESR